MSKQLLMSRLVLSAGMIVMALEPSLAVGPCSTNRIFLDCSTMCGDGFFVCPLEEGNSSRTPIYARAVDGIGCVPRRELMCTKPDGTPSTCTKYQISVYVCCDDGSYYPVFNNYTCCIFAS